MSGCGTVRLFKHQQSSPPLPVRPDVVARARRQVSKPARRQFRLDRVDRHERPPAQRRTDTAFALARVSAVPEPSAANSTCYWQNPAPIAGEIIV